MEKKRKIVQYRERLDRTLASPDLTNNEMLKKLVESQLLRSSEPEVDGYNEKVVETKTAEMSNFLDMLRSASSDDSRGRSSNTPHTDWKIKQDNEEFRVMYRKGPEGTPFHTLLVEGFVDAPLDVCLCISWETSLYRKWWPQSIVPTFKILSCERLHEVEIGEQISLVRVKVSWPLSTREAIVHYYLFEYFQDDLIIVLTNSVPESKSVNGTLNGLNDNVIPEAKDVVRVDLVGGFALQKVTSERSYFRTIANMDIKLDFVPPSLINFISRQLIGNGFRLYKKAVTSMTSHGEEELSKALGDPLYVRIRESLYGIKGSKAEDLKQVGKILPAEDLIESKQDSAKDVVSLEDKSNQYENNVMLVAANGVVVDNNKVFGEIVVANSEDIEQSGDDGNDEKVNDIRNDEVDSSVPKEGWSVCISSEVEQALETLDKAISVFREYRLHSSMAPSNFPNEESPCITNGGRAGSLAANFIHLSSKNEVTDEVSNSDMLEGTLHEEPATNSDIQNFRYTRMNSNLEEVNSNKLVPTSPKKNLSRPTLENGEIQDQKTSSNMQLSTDSVQDMSSDDPNKSSNEEKIDTIVIQGMSSDVPKKSSRQRKKLSCRKVLKLPVK